MPTNILFDFDFIKEIPEEGFLIHKEDYSKLVKGIAFNWKVAGEIITVINSKTRNILIEVEKEADNGVYPDILSVVPKDKGVEITSIGIDFKLAYTLQQALGFEACRLEFSSTSNGIYILLMLKIKVVFLVYCFLIL